MTESKMQLRLQPGIPAPDIVLTTVQGDSVHLNDRWSAGPTLLTFLRHFG